MGKLILGNGLLASEIVKQTGWDSISRKNDGIDANGFNSWSYLLSNYDTIINCIANTDTYSTDKQSHWDINYKFVSDLVEYCNRENKKLVHISTDYVYTNSVDNASEEDVPVHGRNWYSYTKLLADGYIELKSKNYLICRGTHKPNPFPYDKAWIDQIGSFDYSNNIARIIIKLINNDCSGLYNVGTSTKSMFDLAKNTKEDIEEGLKPNNVPDNTSMNVDKSNSIISKEVVN